MAEFNAGGEAGLLPGRLLEGYEVFLRGRFRREQDRYRELADRGQSPRFCSSGVAIRASRRR